MLKANTQLFKTLVIKNNATNVTYSLSGITLGTVPNLEVNINPWIAININ